MIKIDSSYVLMKQIIDDSSRPCDIKRSRNKAVLTGF